MRPFWPPGQFGLEALRSLHITVLPVEYAHVQNVGYTKLLTYHVTQNIAEVVSGQ